MNGLSSGAESDRRSNPTSTHHRPKMNGDTHAINRDKKAAKPLQPPTAPSNGPRNSSYGGAQGSSNLSGSHSGHKNSRTPPNALMSTSAYSRHSAAQNPHHHQPYSQAPMQQTAQYSHHTQQSSGSGHWAGSAGPNGSSSQNQQSRQDGPPPPSGTTHYRYGGGSSHAVQTHSYPPPSSYHAHTHQSLTGSTGLIHVSPAAAAASPSVATANQPAATKGSSTGVTTTGVTATVAAVTTAHSPSPATPSTVTPTSNAAGTSPSAASSSGRASGGPPHYHSSPSSYPGEQLSKTNLYLRGLSLDATDAYLHQLCKQYGRITSTKAILDKATGKCKGYGFVDFENAVAAENAVRGLQTKGIQVQMAKQQEQDPTNLYIANLPTNMNEADLQNLLQAHGPVTSTRILRENNESKGVGFARMDSKEICELVIQTFNKTMISGCREPLLVKFADAGAKKRTQFKSKDTPNWEIQQTAQMYEPQLAQNGNLLASVQPGGFRGYQQPYTHIMPYFYMPQAPTVPHMELSQIMSGPPVDPSQMAYNNSMAHINAQLNQLQLPVSQTYVTTTPPYPPYPPMMQHIQVPEEAPPLQNNEEYTSTYTPNSVAQTLVPQHPRY